MPTFSTMDYVALGFFLAAWLGYHSVVEITSAGGKSLNAAMNPYRFAWMRQMLKRDNRIVDSTIMASLQNGTAFFASTSLLAIGGTLALLRSANDIITLFADLPFGLTTTKPVWEIKVAGLCVIFTYAFFKFAWSYRLFNYTAILMGAVPQADEPGAEAAADRAGRMNTVAGRHFNRGQRAFFFALAYLGWLVSAGMLLATTAAVLLVMWRRQFTSDAHDAIL